MQHLRGIAQRGLDVVRDHDDGDIVAEVDELDEVVQLPRRHGVQPGDRLVEQQQLLRGAQGAREQHALLLAAGERLIALVFQVLNAHALQIFQRSGAVRFGIKRPAVHPVQPPGEHDLHHARGKIALQLRLLR